MVLRRVSHSHDSLCACVIVHIVHARACTRIDHVKIHMSPNDVTHESSCFLDNIIHRHFCELCLHCFSELLAVSNVMGKVYLGVENATLATEIEFGAKVTTGFLNESSTNVSMVESLSFIFTPYAYAISGVFVWSALFLACFFVSIYT